MLRPGETLWGALLRSQLGRSEAAGIIAALRGEVNMRRVQPGERAVLARGEDGRILHVTYRRSLTERYEVSPDGGGWRVRKVLVPIETRVAAVAGTVSWIAWTARRRSTARRARGLSD
ncbi:MAG: hypothetical protein HY725_19485 [Candidatus Rokubacteria bacterium]|nr:hypothetical protein [Candidatus Rokubacteria bacterium]